MLVLLALSAFFSGTETAYFSLDRIQRRRLLSDSHGREALELLKRPDRLLSAILFGNTLVNIFASAIATIIVEQIVPGSLGLGVAVLVMTFLLLVFGEISPKTYAVANAEEWARRTAGVMHFFMKATAPVASVLSSVSVVAAKAAGVVGQEEEFSSLEVLSLMELGRLEGVLGPEAGVTIALLTLNEKQCDQAMIPRSEVAVLRKEWSQEKMLSEMLSANFTRYPMLGGSREEILGFVDSREFLTGGSQEVIIHDVPGFPETVPLGDVLRHLRMSGSGIGVVFDEYGDWTGIITVEDILETALFQQLSDSTSLPPGVTRRNEGFDVPASIKIHVLSDMMGVTLEAVYAETAGGLLEEATGRIPAIGERITLQGCVFHVMSAIGPRLEELHVGLCGKDDAE